MRKKTFRLSSGTAITLLLAALALSIWLVSMYCVTSIAAEHAAARYLQAYEDQASKLAASHIEDRIDLDVSYENYKESLLWETVSAELFPILIQSIEGDSGFFKRRSSNESFAATAIYDANGNCIERSWDDYFFFQYLTEEQWNAGEDRSYNNARAFFDRELLTDAGREMVNDGDIMAFDAIAMRFTGTFDGTRLVPVRIESISKEDYSQAALYTYNNGGYTISSVVNACDDLQWLTIYEAPNTIPSGTEMVTLYADWFDVCYAQPSPSFSYNGQNYDGLDTLLEEIGPTLADGSQNLTRYEGLDLLILSANYCEASSDMTDYVPNDTGMEEAPFYIVSAVYCSPWRTAFRELRNVYIVTLLITLLLVLFVRSVIKEHLIVPIQLVGEAMTQDRDRLKVPPNDIWTWQEGHKLIQGFSKSVEHHRACKNEITRLNTAIDYAKDAEENRRQMTSNIAHELKTPLAVIHSYAEGLKEQIAEDKRDRYLDIILSESERMDNMVLEMLDLSRLEAGRVKLSREDFSLSELTYGIFEKLSMAIQAKNLKVKYDFPENCMVNADLSRIEQVIENFVTNAVKYTPINGHIRTRIRVSEYGTTFSIGNDSEPLAPETLAKVWDTFYRADESRSGVGTGLGLAIAKNIIELHGGTCSARNIQFGVEFSFMI